MGTLEILAPAGFTRFAHKNFGSLCAFGKDTRTFQLFLKASAAFIEV